MTEPVTYTATTPRHKLPLLFAGQAQKEFYVNEGLALLDAMLHPFVEAVVDVPPTSPAIGACWLVGTVPTGLFAGRARSIAAWDGTQWSFGAAREGVVVRVRGDGSRYFDGMNWQRISVPASPTGGSVVDQQVRDALATLMTRLVSAGIFSA